MSTNLPATNDFNPPHLPLTLYPIPVTKSSPIYQVVPWAAAGFSAVSAFGFYTAPDLLTAFLAASLPGALAGITGVSHLLALKADNYMMSYRTEITATEDDLIIVMVHATDPSQNKDFKIPLSSHTADLYHYGKDGPAMPVLVDTQRVGKLVPCPLPHEEAQQVMTMLNDVVAYARTPYHKRAEFREKAIADFAATMNAAPPENNTPTPL